MNQSYMTPYNQGYPTCERACARFVVYTGDTDPGIMSEILDLLPTSLVRTGDVHVNSIGRRRVAKRSRWILDSEGLVDSLDLRDHIDWLEARLSAKRDAIALIQGMPNVVAFVGCSWWSRSGHGGPALWPRQMLWMATLNLEWNLEVMFFPGDEDDAPSE